MEQFLQDQIKVKLTGSKDLTYTINLYDNSFVRKWLVEFHSVLQKQLVLEKNFCFLGFADNVRDLDYLVKELNLAIKQINDFNFSQAWVVAGLEPYKINKTFTAEDFMYPGTLPTGKVSDGDLMSKPGLRLKHDACNLLHRWFEDLQGQAWGLSEYYKLADTDTKYAIRQLNNLCHEIESWVLSNRKLIVDKEWVRPSQITTFINAPRKDLADEDYEYFIKNRYDRELGGVYLHWSQIGKTLYEVFRDEDGKLMDDATCSAINHQKFYSGEFDIEWGRTITNKQQFKKEEIDQFKKWLEMNNFNWEDPKLALGYIKIGQVDLQKSFNTTDPLQIYHQLIDCLNINTIELTGKYNIKTTYDYELSDSNWKQIQIKELLKGYESHSLR